MPKLYDDHAIEARASRRRRALRQFMATHDLKPAEWAKQAGLNNANAIYNFLNGRTHSLSLETLTRLAQVVPGTNVGQLTGELMQIVARETRTVTVKIAAEGGKWLDRVEMNPGEQYEVSVPDTELPASAFGVELRKGSLDSVYEPVSIGVCLPYGLTREPLRTGKKAVVQRVRDDGLLEITVREIEADQAGLWLVSRTLHHALRGGAVPVPAEYSGQIWINDSQRFQILAVLVGVYSRLS